MIVLCSYMLANIWLQELKEILDKKDILVIKDSKVRTYSHVADKKHNKLANTLC